MIRFAITACVIASSTRCAMKKAALLSILIAVMLLAVAVVAEAQQPKKIPRIGYLGNTASGQAGAGWKTFRERLRELGYIEGQNITIEPRFWEGKVERLPDLA